MLSDSMIFMVHLQKLVGVSVDMLSFLLFSEEVEVPMCLLRHSFNVLGPGHVAGDIYPSELEATHHLHFSTIDDEVNN